MKRFLLAITFALVASRPALAQPAASVHLVEKIDVLSAIRGSEDRRVHVLDNLDLLGDVDLDRLIGWHGATAHVHVMNNLGTSPNERIGTLQGIDNIEVRSHRLHLFEAWVQQRLGEHGSVRAGLYDLNTEFYANSAAGLLIAPAFGVGSELSATGVNGPSIFPSTAVTVRVERRFGKSGYVRAALLNATAGCPGEPNGVDFDFRNGLLAIGEIGVERAGAKLAVGYWRYTKAQEDFTETDADGAPLRQRAHGAYIVAELRVAGADDRRAVTLFGRVGVSDGKTTPYQGGAQAGVLVERVLADRPDSAFSIAVNHGVTTKGYRAMRAADGLPVAKAETALELAYSDKVAPWLTLKPDLQFIFDRGGIDRSPTVVVAALRTTFSF